jgi:SAM-dependent methyltransferase
MDWRKLSKDPNSPAVLAFRRSALADAREAYWIEDRCQYISHLARGKKVLDIGVVEHFTDAAQKYEWLHAHLSGVASSCLGVDILEDEIHELRKLGYHVRCFDVAQKSLDETFNVIVIGDVIEHVGNPGALIKNAANMLETGGRLVVTTPNPWYLNPVLKNIFGGKPFSDSADHVTWFDPSTMLEIAQRAGLKLDSYAGIKMRRSGTLLSNIVIKLAPLLVAIGIKRELFAKSILYELIRV